MLGVGVGVGAGLGLLNILEEDVPPQPLIIAMAVNKTMKQNSVRVIVLLKSAIERRAARGDSTLAEQDRCTHIFKDVLAKVHVALPVLKNKLQVQSKLCESSGQRKIQECSSA